MTLNFRKHGPDNTNGEHYSAIASTWPEQHRFVIEKDGHQWRITEYHHTPGLGFQECGGAYAKTLAAAKARCEGWLVLA